MNLKPLARVLLALIFLISVLGIVGVQSLRTPVAQPVSAPLNATGEHTSFLKKKGDKIEYGFYTASGNWQSDETDQGKTVMLFFWATWSQPSASMLPLMAWLWDKYRESSFTVVAVALDSEPAGFLNYLRQEKVKLPCALLPPELATASGLLAGVPTLYVLSPQGIIVKKEEGLLNRDQLEKYLLPLLSKPEEHAAQP